MEVGGEGWTCQGGVDAQEDSRARGERQQVEGIGETPERVTAGQEASENGNGREDNESVEDPPEDISQDERALHACTQSASLPLFAQVQQELLALIEWKSRRLPRGAQKILGGVDRLQRVPLLL